MCIGGIGVLTSRFRRGKALTCYSDTQLNRALFMAMSVTRQQTGAGLKRHGGHEGRLRFRRHARRRRRGFGAWNREPVVFGGVLMAWATPPCVCCGLFTEADDEDQPACGHLFCYICLGRGHQEDCIRCEKGSVDPLAPIRALFTPEKNGMGDLLVIVGPTYMDGVRKSWQSAMAGEPALPASALKRKSKTE